MGLKLKVALVVIALFFVFDELILRTLNISIHPTPEVTMITLSILANVILACVHIKKCRQFNMLKSLFNDASRDLTETIVMRNKYFDKYTQLNNSQLADTKTFEMPATEYRSIKPMASWVLKLEELTDAGLPVQEAMKTVQYMENYCSAFHTNGCGCMSNN